MAVLDAENPMQLSIRKMTEVFHGGISTSVLCWRVRAAEEMPNLVYEKSHGQKIYQEFCSV